MSDEYEDVSQLEGNPPPDCMIRVFMIMKNLNENVELPIQNLEKLHKERNGYTVVEWGNPVQIG